MYICLSPGSQHPFTRKVSIFRIRRCTLFTHILRTLAKRGGEIPYAFEINMKRPNRNITVCNIRILRILGICDWKSQIPSTKSSEITKFGTLYGSVSDPRPTMYSMRKKLRSSGVESPNTSLSGRFRRVLTPPSLGGLS